MPRKERASRPDEAQLDFSELIDGLDPAPVDETAAQAAAVEVSAILERQASTAADRAWEKSPYAWIRNLPTARKSRVGISLLAETLSRLGAPVAPTARTAADFTYAGVTFKVRMSMLWESGELVLQHVPDATADRICLLGITPARLYLWVPPSGTAVRHCETDWLTFTPDEPPAWLTGWGGDVSEAAAHIRALRPVAS